MKYKQQNSERQDMYNHFENETWQKETERKNAEIKKILVEKELIWKEAKKLANTGKNKERDHDDNYSTNDFRRRVAHSEI